MPKGRKPTPKQLRFCREYVVDLNASAAYVRAGYSENGARQSAHNLLTKEYILDAIAKLQAARAKRVELTADSVVAELASLGFSNMLDYVTVTDDGGSVVLDLSKLTRAQAAAIGELVIDEFTEGKGDGARDVRRVRFKLADKKGPLVELGKHLGVFPKANGNGAAAHPPVNIYNVTQDQVAANMDAVFKDAAAEQAKKRALN